MYRATFATLRPQNLSKANSSHWVRSWKFAIVAKLEMCSLVGYGIIRWILRRDTNRFTQSNICIFSFKSLVSFKNWWNTSNVLQQHIFKCTILGSKHLIWWYYCLECRYKTLYTIINYFIYYKTPKKNHNCLKMYGFEPLKDNTFQLFV